MVVGLQSFAELTLLGRRIAGGAIVSQPPDAAVEVLEAGPSRVDFSRTVFGTLRRARGRFDAVIVQGYAAAALAANLAAQGTGVPTMMLVCSPLEAYYAARRQARDPERPFHWTEHRGLGVLARLNARIGRRYIVLSEYLAGVVRSHGARAAIDVVPVYGVDTRLFAPAVDSKAEVRSRRELPPDAALIFFSSRMAPEKDAGTLLAALRRLVDAGRSVCLLHRSGGHREFLAAAERAGVGSRVIATPAVHPEKELPDDYAACDVCVQASREEGLGFSVLESLSCGVPVVAAAVGGLRETVIDGRTGWTYPAGDPVALASALAAVLDDPAEASRRALRGRSMVIERYERRAVFDRLRSLLEKDIGGQRW